MGVSNTLAGAKLRMAGTQPIDFTSEVTALAAFKAIDASQWTEIKEISDVGEFGSSANVVTFPVLSDDFVRKAKGTRDAGDPVIVVGFVANDPGQIKVRAAERTKYYYNFMLELADGEDELHFNTKIYFRAIVAGVPKQFGGNEDFTTESYTLGIYPRPVEELTGLIVP